MHTQLELSVAPKRFPSATLGCADRILTGTNRNRSPYENPRALTSHLCCLCRPARRRCCTATRPTDALMAPPRAAIGVPIDACTWPPSQQRKARSGLKRTVGSSAWFRGLSLERWPLPVVSLIRAGRQRRISNPPCPRRQLGCLGAKSQCIRNHGYR